MVDALLFFPIALSFFITLVLLPFWIKKATSIKLVWDDMNKWARQKVAGSGGVIAILGFVIGMLVLIAYRTFVLQTQAFLIEILAMLNIVLFVSVVGLVDDLLGWQHGGLRRKHRLILAILASIPLVVINAGESQVAIPFLGVLDLGLVYPLIIIPIGVTGATYTFNFLAGFNGLEAGQGILMFLALALVAFFTGSPWLSVISLCMVAALLGFLAFNIYPAKVFPGDSLTYAIGALIATIAILGNFEKIAVFFFIPYIIETGLKLRGRLVKHSFGKPKKDGSLELKYNKLYGLTHVSIFLLKKWGVKVTERKVVYLIWAFQILVILLGLVIFRKGIF